jgi:hypothetical protein
MRSVTSPARLFKKNSSGEDNDIFKGKYMLIAVKKGLRSFILTCYITDMIKKGVTLWERK